MDYTTSKMGEKLTVERLKKVVKLAEMRERKFWMLVVEQNRF